MPKAKTRSHSNTTKNSKRNGTARVNNAARSTAAVEPARSVKRGQARQVPQGVGRQGRQNLFMSAMVALGCWGFAATFIFFTTDPNRYLFGGMAVIMAMMWTALFANRLRKMLQEKPS